MFSLNEALASYSGHHRSIVAGPSKHLNSFVNRCWTFWKTRDWTAYKVYWPVHPTEIQWCLHLSDVHFIFLPFPPKIEYSNPWKKKRVQRHSFRVRPITINERWKSSAQKLKTLKMHFDFSNFSFYSFLSKC